VARARWRGRFDAPCGGARGADGHRRRRAHLQERQRPHRATARRDHPWPQRRERCGFRKALPAPGGRGPVRPAARHVRGEHPGGGHPQGGVRRHRARQRVRLRRGRRHGCQCRSALAGRLSRQRALRGRRDNRPVQRCGHGRPRARDRDHLDAGDRPRNRHALRRGPDQRGLGRRDELRAPAPRPRRRHRRREARRASGDHGTGERRRRRRGFRWTRRVRPALGVQPPGASALPRCCVHRLRLARRRSPEPRLDPRLRRRHPPADGLLQHHPGRRPREHLDVGGGDRPPTPRAPSTRSPATAPST
jgi:hypothetical protein